jgi:hypothetical protein
MWILFYLTNISINWKFFSNRFYFSGASSGNYDLLVNGGYGKNFSHSIHIDTIANYHHFCVYNAPIDNILKGANMEGLFLAIFGISPDSPPLLGVFV